MSNKLRRIFAPTPEELQEDIKKYQQLYDELKLQNTNAILDLTVTLFYILL